MTDRIAALERMVQSRPDDPRARFGLALEYLGAGRLEEGVAALRAYLQQTDDEGNAWGRLASALHQMGDVEGAREAWQTGIAASLRHGHPTMAAEFEASLAELDS